jgi:hypothetical protein
MEKIKNEVSIRLVADDFGILTRNGMDLVCPFIPPVPFRQQKQNIIGGGQDEIVMQKSACNTMCPLFQYSGSIVELHCGGDKITHKIKEILSVEEQMKPQEPMRIIKDKNIN